MNDLIDLHTHSIMSGHAYGTLKENIEHAKEIGLTYYGISEHAPSMDGSTHPMNFCNYRAIPKQHGNTMLLTGVELNILNANGDVDLPKRTIDQLDYTIASLHINVCPPMSREENTAAYINAMKHPFVTIIGHPDDGRYEFDVEPVILAAKQHHKLIEVNNSSLQPNAFRINSHALYRDVLRYCKQYQVPVIMGSDAHWCDSVGNHEYALQKIQEEQFPMELVVNFNQALIEEYILKK